MKTKKIITLAVLLSACYSFVAAAPHLDKNGLKYLPQTTAAIREAVDKACTQVAKTVAKGTNVKNATKAAAANNASKVVVYRRTALNPEDNVLRMAGMQRTPEGVVPGSRQVAEEGLDVPLSHWSGDVLPPSQELLNKQYFLSREMAPRWNSETGVWETTDGKGNIVPWESLSNAERHVRWAQMEPSQSYLNLDSPVVQGTHFEMGENYESFLAKCDFYFYHPQFQQWMRHHSDGTITLTESTLKNGEVVFEDRLVSEKYMQGTILIPHMGEGTVYYFEGYHYWGEDPAPEHMKEVFDTGRVSTLLPTE